jgi:hypothetical protein
MRKRWAEGGGTDGEADKHPAVGMLQYLTETPLFSSHFLLILHSNLNIPKNKCCSLYCGLHLCLKPQAQKLKASRDPGKGKMEH